MALLESYLSSSAVQSSAFNLGGTKVTVNFKNKRIAPDVPGKFTSSDVVGPVDILGFENPILTVNGAFNEIESPKLSTFKLFIKETSSVYFYDPVFFRTAHKVSIGEVNFSREVADGISSTGSDQVKGPIVTYQMNLILTE